MSGQLTTAGLTALAAGGMTSTKFPYVAIGTGSVAFSLAMTAMGTELGSRVAITSVLGSGGVGNALDYITNNSGVGTLTEIGLWDAATAGNLLAYQTFATAIVKEATRSMIANFIMSLRNLKGTAALTAGGIEALRTGGFTTTKFPYIAVGDGVLKSKRFSPAMVDMVSEVERKASAVSLVGPAATFSATFSTTVQDKTEVALWSASSGGTLLAWAPLPAATVPTKHTAKLAFTLANG
jgi:hypothetical protein